MNNIEAFIKNFAAKTGNAIDPIGTISFGMNESETMRATEMILDGRRTAMIYPKFGYRRAMHPQPKIGDLNIVTDWNGNPVCMIETVNIEELLMCEVNDMHCLAAGEYDSASAWRDGAVKAEVEELGESFDGNTPMIIETFRLV